MNRCLVTYVYGRFSDRSCFLTPKNTDEPLFLVPNGAVESAELPEIPIFLSDHAEGFLEHDRFFHSYAVYSELINIPFIIRYPAVFNKGVEEKHVQHIDVFPTIAGLLHLDAPLKLEGNDFSRTTQETFKGGDDSKIFSEHLIREWGIPQRGLLCKNWKLIQNLKTGDFLLFDMEKDPGDLRNIIDERREIAETLKADLSSWRENLKGIKKEEKIRLGAELRKKFRSLGYLQ